MLRRAAAACIVGVLLTSCRSQPEAVPEAVPGAEQGSDATTDREAFEACGDDKAALRAVIDAKEAASQRLNASRGTRRDFTTYADALERLATRLEGRDFGSVLATDRVRLGRALILIAEGEHRAVAAKTQEAFDAGERVSARGEDLYDLVRGRVIWFECDVALEE